MAKRSNFEHRAKDAYFTPPAAAGALTSFTGNCSFYEPCAGDGRLVDHLERKGFLCKGYSDIDPEHARKIARDEYGEVYREDVKQADALKLKRADLFDADMIITNPPWSRDKKSGYLLHKMIEHFSDMVPTWLLFDADWMHTKQATPYFDRCRVILSVGRVKWIPNSPSTGKDNCCWYLFDKGQLGRAPIFVPRF